MDESFDWLSSNMKLTETTIRTIQDLEFLDILEDIDADGQDRENVRKMLCKRRKRVHVARQGWIGNEKRNWAFRLYA